LVKNIGYFDFPENATPVLSGIMQSDTTIINGIATDSIPPQVEAGTLILIAIMVAFYFCWQQAIACIILAPFMTFGNLLAQRF
jgi:hypothetical protein